jgi:hypothetical protein
VIRPSTDSIPVAARLARSLIEASNAAGIQRALQQELGVPAGAGTRVPPAAGPAKAADIVGVWKATDEEGQRAFTRAEVEGEPRHFWAQVDRIPPKGARHRVVLIGESVARGYLYDPIFNPAGALDALLRHASNGDDFEVVDLARNGLLFPAIAPLVTSALALDPDAFVIFAGNNWRLPNSVRTTEIAALLRAGAPWTDILPLIAETWRKDIRSLLRTLVATCAPRGIPIVWVMPESNLADWHYDDGWHNPLLTDAESTAWTERRRTAIDALERGDMDRAAAGAREMLAIDAGAAPFPYEALGAWHASRDEYVDALRMFHTARNVCIAMPVTKEPGCYPLVQDILREVFQDSGAHLVDLPRYCAEVSPNGLPGRELFVDYCHMTARGLRLAMACAADTLLPLFEKSSPGWRELDAIEAGPPANVAAQAHLGAALVTALFGRRGLDAVRFHLLEAVRQYPEILDIVSLFTDVHMRSGPWFLSPAFQRLWSQRDRFPIVERLAPGGMAVKPNDFNATLARAFTDVAARHLPNHGGAVQALLLDQRGLPDAPGRLNLLDRSSCAADLNTLEYLWLQKGIYFTAWRPASAFQFTLREPADVVLTLTCRTRPGEPHERPVTLLANGVLVERLITSPRWRTFTITVPRSATLAGLNSLVLQWTPPRESHAERREAVVHALMAADGQPLQQCVAAGPLYPALGDIHEFWASASAVAARPARAVEQTLSAVPHV